MTVLERVVEEGSGGEKVVENSFGGRKGVKDSKMEILNKTMGLGGVGFAQA